MINGIISLCRMFAAAVRTHYAEYNTTGKLWLTMGIAALIVDAGISYQYGITQTTWHGIGFALVAIFFAKVPDATYVEFEEKRYGSGLGMLIACMILGGAAMWSHLGYGAGVRVGDIQQTGFHNANLESFQDDSAERDQQVADLKATAKRLDAEMDALVNTKVGAWAVSVRPSTAAELAGMIEAKQVEVEREGRTGKGRRYQDRSNELAHLTALQGKAAAIEANDAAYKEAIAALSASRTKVAGVEYRSSSTVNQTSVAAQIYKAMWKGDAPEDAIKPSAVEVTFTNLFITGGASLAFMVMAPLGFFVAGRNRRKASEIEADAKQEEQKAASGRPIIVERTINNTDDSWKDIVAEIGKAIPHNLPKLQAA